MLIHSSGLRSTSLRSSWNVTRHPRGERGNGSPPISDPDILPQFRLLVARLHRLPDDRGQIRLPGTFRVPHVAEDQVSRFFFSRRLRRRRQGFREQASGPLISRRLLFIAELTPSPSLNIGSRPPTEARRIPHTIIAVTSSCSSLPRFSQLEHALDRPTTSTRARPRKERTPKATRTVRCRWGGRTMERCRCEMGRACWCGGRRR